MNENQNQQNNNSYNEDKYKGCWSCKYHKDIEGFTINCGFIMKTVYLRCHHWKWDGRR